VFFITFIGILMTSIKKLLFCAFVFSPIAISSQAAVTGQVDVLLNVSAGCSVEGAQVEGNMNKFGALDFGKTSGVWNNVLTAQVASTANAGHLSVKCDSADPIDFKVSIDGGERSNRTLKHISGSDEIGYNIYRDAARTNLYAINTPQTFTASGNQAQEIPIFGAIAANMSNPKAQGDYKDTLLVTVNF